MSDGYLGLDQQYDIPLKIVPAPECEANDTQWEGNDEPGDAMQLKDDTTVIDEAPGTGEDTAFSKY